VRGEQCEWRSCSLDEYALTTSQGGIIDENEEQIKAYMKNTVKVIVCASRSSLTLAYTLADAVYRSTTV
jgi:adenine/guanine phosphoribosyltransferase-like PRPP-binding protein